MLSRAALARAEPHHVVFVVDGDEVDLDIRPIRFVPVAVDNVVQRKVSNTLLRTLLGQQADHFLETVTFLGLERFVGARHGFIDRPNASNLDVPRDPT